MADDRTRAERREFARVRLMTPFHGTVLGVDTPLMLRDISFGGFAVESAIPFPLDTEHAFEFDVMGHRVVLTARVAHCTMRHRGSDEFHVVGFAFARHQASDDDTVEALVRALGGPIPTTAGR